VPQEDGENRETGENPARSRHCDETAAYYVSSNKDSKSLSQETCPGFAAFERSRKGVQAARVPKAVFSPADRLFLFAKDQRSSGFLLEQHTSQFRTSRTSPRAFTVALCLGLLLAACSTRNNKTDGPVSLRQLPDEAGRTITVPDTVTRFISLAPNITEIVYAIGAGDALVGRTTYCNYPPEAEKVEAVGDTLKPSIEKIIALKPQIVFVSTASQLEAFTSELEAHHIAVYVTDSHDLEGVFRSIERIAELLKRQPQANQLLRQLRTRVAAIEDKVKSRPPIKVFYQVSGEPLYTIGRDAFLTDLIRRAGGISVTADVPGAWPKYSAESALAAGAEAIVLPAGGSMGEGNSNVASALRRSPAVANGRVYKINADHLSRPGPRSVDGLEELARALHPEVFTK
jgi:iron complex transport system substrate-binding protein